MTTITTMLPAALITGLLHVTTGCQNIQLYFGHLSSSLEIESVSLRSGATACNCCGLCHKNPACKSLMFQTDRRECVLYSTVGGPAVFGRERSRSKETFYFMPGRSKTDEFCNSDSDCITAGDFCRGRICTTDTTVTCRDFFLYNNNLRDERYWGYIAGRQLLLECSMGRREGYTKLVHATPSRDWSETSRLNHTTYYTDGTARTSRLYSILW